MSNNYEYSNPSAPSWLWLIVVNNSGYMIVVMYLVLQFVTFKKDLKKKHRFSRSENSPV